MNIQQQKISVLLVGNPLERLSLRGILEAESQLQIVADADDSLTASAAVNLSLYDVAIVVVSEPAGIEGCCQLSRQHPDLRIIALATNKEAARQALRAGMMSVVSSEDAATQLKAAVLRVAAAGRYLSSNAEAQLKTPDGKNGGDEIFGTLTRTKLHCPPRPPEFVERPKLLAQLVAGQTRPLTLITAPAGSGKSVLVSCWLETCDWPSGWLSLETDDSDIEQFVRYLTAAIQDAAPGSCQQTQSLLRSGTNPSAAVLSEALHSDLENINHPFLLVLDDYHRVAVNSPVQVLLDELIAQPPIALHLALLSRRDPPLSLLPLRAKGQITELRMRDLFFDAEESRSLVEQITAQPLTEEQIEQLQQSMEGWPAGLRLLSLAMRRTANPQTVLSQASGAGFSSREYLIAEIISRLNPQMQRWLCRLSLLDRFCPELCEIVCPDPKERATFDSHQFVTSVDQEGLFVIPLDLERTWYRFHHVFKESLSQLLQQRTTEPERAALHKQASAWFESHQFITDAIKHALLCGDDGAVAELIKRHQWTELQQERWRVVGKWLEMLPRHVIDSHRELLIAEGWVAADQRDLATLQQVLLQVARLPDSEPAQLSSDLDCFRGYVCYAQGDFETALSILERAMADLSAVPAATEGLISTLYGVLLLLNGKMARARSELARLSNLPEATEGFRSQATIGVMIVNLFAGDYFRVQAEAKRLTSNRLELQARISNLLGCALLESFQLDDARQHLAKAAELRYLLPTTPAVETLASLALTLQLLGQPQAAEQMLEELSVFTERNELTAGTLVVASCRARLALLRGDLDTATRWTATMDNTVTRADLIVSMEVPQMTLARVLVATGSGSELERAARLLKQIRELAQTADLGCHLIEAGVLESLLLARQDRRSESLAALSDALESAEPGSAIRPFIEPGTALEELLNALPQDGNNAAFLKQIQRLNERRSVSLHPPDAGSQSVVTTTLTNRELDTPALIAQRLRNKEIAAKLFVSTETVKTHLSHLYQKLGVKNRREAAELAKSILSAQ